MSEAPDRNLALELVRVTEAAALASARWVGFGDKEAADQAGVDAMRHMLATVEMEGVVVIGEGEKDEAPMLFNGERIGTGSGVSVDVAVDPREGSRTRSRWSPRPNRAPCSTPVRFSTWRSWRAARTWTRSSTCTPRSRKP